MRSRERVGNIGSVTATAVLLLAVVLSACEGMSSGEKGAAAGVALGSGIAMVAGGGVAATVGAGLIGGAAGYLGGSAVGR